MSIDFEALTREERHDLWLAILPSYREALRRSDTLLYAIQAGENGPVKIGLTVDPAQRLRTLQTANAAQLHGLAAWKSAWLRSEEKDLHEHFATAHIRGEWFQPTPELIEYVTFMGGIFCDWEDSA